MKRLATTAVLALAFTNLGLYSQTPDPLSFFPHHLGDIWEYVEAGHPEFYWQNIVLADSLGPDGRYYIQTSRRGNFIVDTTQYLVYRVYALGQDLVYKLNANLGDYWIVAQLGDERMSARVVNLYQTFLFGVGPVTVKVINNYFVNASGTDSLLTNTDHIAEGFGLIRQDFDTMPGFFLRGARINGVLYGTVSSVYEPVVRQYPRCLRLEQNYPNPFNPTTTIIYELKQASTVEISLFDCSGKEIMVLLKSYQEAGAHSVYFNGEFLSSGVYFFTARTQNEVQTKKMLLLR